MILGDVEETVTTVEIDEETYEELYKVPERTPIFEHKHTPIAWGLTHLRAHGLFALADGSSNDRLTHPHLHTETHCYSHEH